MAEPTPSSSPCTGARAYGEGTPASLVPHGHGRLERHFPRLPRWMVTNSRGRGLCKPCTVYHWLLLAALWRGLKAAWPQLWQEKHKWYWIALLLENVFANYHLPFYLWRWKMCEEWNRRAVKPPANIFIFCENVCESIHEGSCVEDEQTLTEQEFIANDYVSTFQQFTDVTEALLWLLCMRLLCGGCSVNREACLWQSYLHSSLCYWVWGLLGLRRSRGDGDLLQEQRNSKAQAGNGSWSVYPL